jgi:hypothetical protein
VRGAALIPVLLATSAVAAEGRGMEMTFQLPRPLDEAATATLEVRVGPLAPGQKVSVTTPTGELIGTISPFGAKAREHAAVYTLPVPREAFRAGTLATRVTITEGKLPPRAPTAAEVQSLKLVPPSEP